MNEEKKVIGKECQHITYCVAKDGSSDAMFIKEYLYYEDGSRDSHLKMIENFERPFWVTKPSRRDHTDKLQYEHMDNLTMGTCREMDLLRKADLALGGNGFVKTKRQLFQSPYIYGCSIKPQCLIKHAYHEKYPTFMSQAASVAVCDTETDMLHNTEEIIIGAVSCKEVVWQGIVRSFFDGMPDELILEKLKIKEKELLSEVIEKRNIKVQYELFDNSGDLCVKMISMVHKLKPDFLAFWNMNFDVQKIKYSLEKYGYDLGEVFSDPSVPKKYRFFKYKEGADSETTNAGKVKSLNFEMRWHVAEAPATFFMIDGMTLYYRVRMTGGQEEGGYGLDSVLDRNLNISKLKIKELEGIEGGEWHREMQARFKFEYCIYNLFDDISVEMLDEETGDISIKLPAQCLNSDFTDFKGNPLKLADDMYFNCLESNHVFGASIGSVETDDDKLCLPPTDFINTLPSYMGHEQGIDFIKTGARR